MYVTIGFYEDIEESIKGLRSDALIEIECLYCGDSVSKKKGKIQAAIKNQTKMFCNNACGGSYRKSQATGKYKCILCSKKFERRHKAVLNNTFCSKSCAAKHNNKRRQISRPVNIKRVCPGCGGQKMAASKMCGKCDLETKKSIAKSKFLNSTFGDLKKKANYKSHMYYNKIRGAARKYVSKEVGDKICKLCGYDFYVELCHVKPISAFPDSALMSEINATKNLAFLCPNHHKEQEAGKITL